jgi:hypothetical protein
MAGKWRLFCDVIDFGLARSETRISQDPSHPFCECGPSDDFSKSFNIRQQPRPD